ncbi:hypothetical protein C7M84_005551 [Penaeus vannamei]|uniref:Uncharacterized protein n=1 Tax=Penaeus vannamei TaxID=6689 RepID=A0A3R7T1P5_PENVA|nr:hypothetical protein C7M84_005551 [Penaeus vannamei]
MFIPFPLSRLSSLPLCPSLPPSFSVSLFYCIPPIICVSYIFLPLPPALQVILLSQFPLRSASSSSPPSSSPLCPSLPPSFSVSLFYCIPPIISVSFIILRDMDSVTWLAITTARCGTSNTHYAPPPSSLSPTHSLLSPRLSFLTPPLSLYHFFPCLSIFEKVRHIRYSLSTPFLSLSHPISRLSSPLLPYSSTFSLSFLLLPLYFREGHSPFPIPSSFFPLLLSPLFFFPFLIFFSFFSNYSSASPLFPVRFFFSALLFPLVFSTFFLLSRFLSTLSPPFFYLIPLLSSPSLFSLPFSSLLSTILFPVLPSVPYTSSSPILLIPSLPFPFNISLFSHSPLLSSLPPYPSPSYPPHTPLPSYILPSSTCLSHSPVLSLPPPHFSLLPSSTILPTHSPPNPLPTSSLSSPPSLLLSPPILPLTPS